MAKTGVTGCNQSRFAMLLGVGCPTGNTLSGEKKFQRRTHMDAFFILPIVILLGLLAWCVLQLKDDM